MYILREVGIRELRQNLSRYLREVAEGERFVVTQRNRPVATLGPPPEADDVIERLIAAGEITPAAGDTLDWEPLEVPGGGTPLSDALRDLRADRLDKS